MVIRNIEMIKYLGTLDFFVSQTLEQACTQLLPLVCAAQRSYYTDVNQSTKDIHNCDLNSENEHSNNDYHRDDSSMLNRLMGVDNLCHIVLTNEVARRSSIAQGNTYINIHVYVYLNTHTKILNKMHTFMLSKLLYFDRKVFFESR